MIIIHYSTRFIESSQVFWLVNSPIFKNVDLPPPPPFWGAQKRTGPKFWSSPTPQPDIARHVPGKKSEEVDAFSHFHFCAHFSISPKITEISAEDFNSVSHSQSNTALRLRYVGKLRNTVQPVWKKLARIHNWSSKYLKRKTNIVM
jgi:hypothetical protein